LTYVGNFCGGKFKKSRHGIYILYSYIRQCVVMRGGKNIKHVYISRAIREKWRPCYTIFIRNSILCSSIIYIGGSQSTCEGGRVSHVVCGNRPSEFLIFFTTPPKFRQNIVYNIINHFIQRVSPIYDIFKLDFNVKL
jgi:hypothetical protein